MGLVDLENQVVLKMKDTDGVETTRLAMYHFHDSASLGVTVTLEQVPAYPNKFFVEVDKITKPDTFAFFDLLSDDVQGANYKWIGPQRCYEDFPLARKHLKPAVRMVLVTEFKPFRMLLAASGWYTAPNTSLDSYCEYFGVAVEEGDREIEKVEKLALKLLACSDEEALVICLERLARMRGKKGCKELYQIDAALETFDKFDEEVVKQEITAMERHDEECENFGKAYAAKKKAFDEKADAGRWTSRASRGTRSTFQPLTWTPSTGTSPPARTSGGACKGEVATAI